MADFWKDTIGTVKQLPNVNWRGVAKDTLTNAGHGMLDTFFGLAHGANTMLGAAERVARPGKHKVNSVNQSRRGQFLAEWEELARARLPKTTTVQPGSWGSKLSRMGGAMLGAVPALTAGQAGASVLKPIAASSAPKAAAGAPAWVQPAVNGAYAAGKTMLGLNGIGRGMWLSGVLSNGAGGARIAAGGALDDNTKKWMDRGISTLETLGTYSIPYRIQTALVQSNPVQRAYANTAATLAGNPQALNNVDWFNPDINKIMSKRTGGSTEEQTPATEYTQGIYNLPTWAHKAAAGTRSAAWALKAMLGHAAEHKWGPTASSDPNIAQPVSRIASR